MEKKKLLDLLKKKFASNKMFFSSKQQCIIELDGTEEVVYNGRLVKALQWFDDIWIYLNIKLKSEELQIGKKDIPFTSICFFQNVDGKGKLVPFIRAEWDSYAPDDAYSHPQPHWHVNNMKDSVLTFNDLSEDHSELLSELLSEQVNTFVNIYAMHFAMAGNWFSDGNMITECKSEKQLIDWIWNLLLHVRKEIEYVKSKSKTI